VIVAGDTSEGLVEPVEALSRSQRLPAITNSIRATARPNWLPAVNARLKSAYTSSKMMWRTLDIFA
jgi:hypothetical protein